MAVLYVKGVEQVSGTVGGDFSTWITSYRLALGNEFTNDRSWLGEFHLVAILDRALDPAEVDQNFRAHALPTWTDHRVNTSSVTPFSPVPPSLLSPPFTPGKSILPID